MRIAIVADAASPHTRPWVEAWRRAGHEVFVFSAQRGEIPADLGCPVLAPLVKPLTAPAPFVHSRASMPPTVGAGEAAASGTATMPSGPPPGPRLDPLPGPLPGTALLQPREAHHDPRATWELRWITRAVRLVPSFRAWLRDVRPGRLLALRLQPEGYLASFGSTRSLAIMAWGQDVLHYALGHPAHRLLARRAVRRADLLIGETETVMEGWRALGAPVERTVLGFTGIDLSFWRPPAGDERPLARGDLARLHPAWAEALSAGAPVLLSPRAMARRGHQEELLRAFAASAPASALLLQAGVGDPATRLRCHGLAESLRMGDRYLDLGGVSRELLRNLAWSAAAIVSLWSPDGLSQSLMEGMAVGLFPVAADLPGNREWIRSGENGILVDPREPSAIGEALRTGWTDEKLRERVFAHNSRILAARADRVRNMEQLTEMIMRRGAGGGAS